MFMKAIKYVGSFIKAQIDSAINAVVNAAAGMLVTLPVLLGVFVPLVALKSYTGINLVRPFLDWAFWPWFVGTCVVGKVFEHSTAGRASMAAWIKRVYGPVWNVLFIVVVRPLMIVLMPTPQGIATGISFIAFFVLVAVANTYWDQQKHLMSANAAVNLGIYLVIGVLLFIGALHQSLHVWASKLVHPSQETLRGRREEG